MPDLDLSSGLHDHVITRNRVTHPLQSVPRCHQKRHHQRLPLGRGTSEGPVVLQKHLRDLKAVLRQLLLPVLYRMRRERGRADVAAGPASCALGLAQDKRMEALTLVTTAGVSVLNAPCTPLTPR